MQKITIFVAKYLNNRFIFTTKSSYWKTEITKLVIIKAFNLFGCRIYFRYLVKQFLIRLFSNAYFLILIHNDTYCDQAVLLITQSF